MLVLLSFIALAKADFNYTSFFEGNWNITAVPVGTDGEEKEEEIKVYSLELSSGSEIGSLIGDLIGEDEDGVATPLNKILISPTDDNTTFTFSISESEAENFEEVSTFTFKSGVDGMKSSHGKTTENLRYSINILDQYTAQLIVYQNEGFTIYRLIKEIPQKKPSLLQSFLPMLPMLIMMFFRQGGMGAPQAQQGQQGQPAPQGEKAKTD
ncbi:hypothetical protein GPJ56_004375 [Histomonas meleagridis]|uniref:uncharacterized protein n=1 Tax=Histomonas meleagridis TaxID=135588 RepID=UPI003559ECE8|nr:hypothetical protein GPJ56_004375 [Histomonas meleagridis]KAH0799980.1 hypothetical protein GO595_007092 [Histomonas meleagridis]